MQSITGKLKNFRYFSNSFSYLVWYKLHIYSISKKDICQQLFNKTYQI